MHAFVAVFAVLFAMILFVPEASEARSFTGTWKDSSGMFVASVKKDQIVINLKADDMTALYWKGTFKPGKSNIIISKADTEALDASMFGSMDKTKRFVYRNQQLRFHFVIAGINRVVALRRTHV